MQIDVSPDVFNALKKHAEPLVDTPNTVLMRVLHISGGNGNGQSSQNQQNAITTEKRRPGRPRKNQGQPEQTQGKQEQGKKTQKHQGRRQGAEFLTPGTLKPYILAAAYHLQQLNKTVNASAVTEVVGKAIEGKLVAEDRKIKASGRQLWQQNITIAAGSLRKEGLLVASSPENSFSWDLSNKGKKEALSIDENVTKEIVTALNG